MPQATSTSPVSTVLYRALARVARLHDRDPALKSLLFFAPREEYDWNEERWEERDDIDPQRGLHAVASTFLGGSSYRPERSLQGFVRDKFRTNEAGSSTDQRLDLGFAALAALSENVAHASGLPRTAAAGEAAGSHGEWHAQEQPGPPGSLLIAPVDQLTSSFGRSVLMMLRHSDAGSTGAALSAPARRSTRARRAPRARRTRRPAAQQAFAAVARPRRTPPGGRPRPRALRRAERQSHPRGRPRAVGALRAPSTRRAAAR